jgi:hypothetical protein
MFPCMFSIVVSANACVAHVWTRRNTFGGESEGCDYFDSMAGISANNRFIARGERPEARRR